MRDQVQEIKDKIDIATVVGERVELVKAGRNLKGKCPFHNERTPSFMVNPTLQIFKCFGCGESGDVLTFLQKYEGMEFPEALGYLAERTGVELKTRISGEDREKKEIMAALALAGKFYAYILKEHKDGERGREYLASRGMRRETVEAFALGVGANGFDLPSSPVEVSKILESFKLLKASSEKIASFNLMLLTLSNTERKSLVIEESRLELSFSDNPPLDDDTKEDTRFPSSGGFLIKKT